jgi:integrase
MRIIEDSFAGLVRAYLASPRFAGYADATCRLWARYLRLAAEPDRLGAISLQTLRPALVQAYLDGMAGKPGKQRTTLAAIKQIESWAIVRDLLPRPITTGVEAEASEGGHTPWTDHHVELVERHGREDMRRMAVLGANTGQRGSDLVRMGWSDIETYRGIRGINVRQQKTGREVWIPITKHLADAMTAWERQPGPFLRKTAGGIWTREQLHHAWVRHRDSNPELELLSREGLVPHGLRGHACVRLLRFGANTRQISDWVGMSEGMVKNYTRLSDQRDNAVAAVFLLDGTQADQFNKAGR